MSVLIGFKSDNVVILAGDKRGSDKEGNTLKNDIKKIVPINNHLAIASAGNIAIAKAVQMEINEVRDKTHMTIEDVINVIQKFYKNLIGKELKTLMSYPVSFLIGGLNNNGEIALFDIYNNYGQLRISEVVDIPCVIIPPEGMRMNEACDILVKNLHSFPENFIERTIREISEISNLVSQDGVRWVYDIRSNMSKIDKI